MVAKIHQLPPTPALHPLDKVALLSEEVLALRILLATVVWKTGGVVRLAEADIAYVAMNGKLNTEPLADGGQRLSISLPGALSPEVSGHA